jgi:hypothetical protein
MTGATVVKDDSPTRVIEEGRRHYRSSDQDATTV